MDPKTTITPVWLCFARTRGCLTCPRLSCPLSLKGCWSFCFKKLYCRWWRICVRNDLLVLVCKSNTVNSLSLLGIVPDTVHETQVLAGCDGSPGFRVVVTYVLCDTVVGIYPIAFNLLGFLVLDFQRVGVNQSHFMNLGNSGDEERRDFDWVGEQVLEGTSYLMVTVFLSENPTILSTTVTTLLILSLNDSPATLGMILTLGCWIHPLSVF